VRKKNFNGDIAEADVAAQPSERRHHLPLR
jgi:hypothetical protein